MRKVVFGFVFLLCFGMIVPMMPLQSGPFQKSASAREIYVQNACTISIAPKSSTGDVGSRVTVQIMVANVLNLSSWQVALKYNATVANCSATWIPDNNVFAGKNSFAPEPILNEPTLDGFNFTLVGQILISDMVDVSDGVLFEANFTLIERGQTSLLIATREKPVQIGHEPWDSWFSSLVDPDWKEIPYTAESAYVTAGPFAVLTLTTSDGGTTSPTPDIYTYPANTAVSVTATPEPEHDFDHWELDGVDIGSENPYSVFMDVNHTLHAVFVLHVPVIWTVDDDGPADFNTIQAAIDSANVTDRDIVLVKSGVYHEHISVYKNVTLSGENKHATIVDGNGSGFVIKLDVSANITGLTLRNGDYGILISTYYPNRTGNTIQGNIITDNRLGGIYLRGGIGLGGNIITDNFITRNALFGIHFENGGNNTLNNNTIMNNGHGIDFYGLSGGNVLRNNAMSSNKYNFGLILRGETRSVFSSPFQSWLINDVDASNTVDGKPICYWANRQNAQVPADAGYVLLANCNNITIDSCSLTNNIQGILLLWTNNTLVVNNSIADNAYGIYIASLSSNNTIVGNKLASNSNGVFLGSISRYTTMKNNSISGGHMNFGVYPDMPVSYGASDLMNDVDTSNTVDGKPIVYWIDQHDKQVPSNAGYVMLIDSTNILIKGLDLSNNVQSIVVLASNNTVIEDNCIANSAYAVDVRDVYFVPSSEDMTLRHLPSFNTTVTGNTLIDNGVGIRIRGSACSTISNNTLHRNPLGICLANADSSTISENVVADSDLGASGGTLYIFYYPERSWEYSKELAQVETGGIIVGSSGNLIYGNTVMNSSIGISMNDFVRAMYGSGNLIFHNNLINNTFYQALDSALPRHNYWDSGYPSGGNYWSDCNVTDSRCGIYQNETGSDGIGDARYSILGLRPGVFSQDQYPLMAPINIFDAGTWNGTRCNIEVFGNSTVSDFQLDLVQKLVSFNVSGEDGSGFCRVAMSNIMIKELWQGNYTILINGQRVEFKEWSDESNTYAYFVCLLSEREVKIIPEFPSSLVLCLVIGFAAVAVVSAKKKFYENV